MDFNKEIYEKAKEKVKREHEQREYRTVCLKARICPSCGEEFKNIYRLGNEYPLIYAECCGVKYELSGV